MTDLKKQGIEPNGVYIVHDSMGVPRYVGRGNIPKRVRRWIGKEDNQLMFATFFIVANKAHARDIETLLIRTAGSTLCFNDRKVSPDIEIGDVRDYGPGTIYVERQRRRGRKRRSAGRRRS